MYVHLGHLYPPSLSLSIGTGLLAPVSAVSLTATFLAAPGLYGMTDRGTIEVGMRADLNVFDLQQLEMQLPEFAYDLPAGAGRWGGRCRRAWSGRWSRSAARGSPSPGP